MPVNGLYLPTDIVIQTDGGTGDLDITFYPKRYLAFVLAFVRCHFQIVSGAPATTQADFVIGVDSDRGIWWDCDLHRWDQRGAADGYDVNFRVPQDELLHWVFQAKDGLRLYWDNPSATNQIAWGVEVGMIPLEVV